LSELGLINGLVRFTDRVMLSILYLTIIVKCLYVAMHFSTFATNLGLPEIQVVALYSKLVLSSKVESNPVQPFLKAYMTTK
jgi:hypothetical protein